MADFKAKSVLLCVSGSIAAYKAAELARLFVREGVSVRVAMTPAATKFVGPMTFEGLTGNTVFSDVFAGARGPVDRYGPEPAAQGASHIEHIAVSKDPDLILVAPATADLIGRVAHGFGDDVVTTSILAANAPVVFAPAMNQRMWRNPIVQENVARLRKAGYFFLGPVSGSLACGEEGIGRMMEPAEILRLLPKVFRSGPAIDLRGAKILVSLGRTEEQLDPVRYISNRSSGKMGIAIAEAARDAGAEVMIVAGPTSVPLPEGVSVTRVVTADEMKAAIHERFDACDALIMVAAVADYRAATEKLHKMESGIKRASIELQPTDDILASLKARRKNQVMVGFALETQAEEQRARQKLTDKGLDLVIVNNPLKEGASFGGDTNLVALLHRSGQTQRLPVAAKEVVGLEILRQVEYLLRNPQGMQPPKVMAEPGNGSGPGPAPGAGGQRPATAGRGRSRGGRRRPPRNRPPMGTPVTTPTNGN
jgi:phosphopantothenoylcysteine decarboxylase/phosphopantothenate--cysteine ligase